MTKNNLIALMLGVGAVAAVCSILVLRWITPPPASMPDNKPVTVKVILQYDSIRPNIIIPPANANTPDIVIPGKQETINYYMADSALIRAIVEEHFRIKVYSDTLRDSTIEAIVNMTISQNYRDEFSFSYRKIAPSVTHQYVYQPPSIKNLVMGGAYFRMQEEKLVPGISAAIINKKRHLFGIQKDAGKFRWNDGWGAQYMVSF